MALPVAKDLAVTQKKPLANAANVELASAADCDALGDEISIVEAVSDLGRALRLAQLEQAIRIGGPAIELAQRRELVELVDAELDTVVQQFVERGECRLVVAIQYLRKRQVEFRPGMVRACGHASVARRHHRRIVLRLVSGDEFGARGRVVIADRNLRREQ